MELVHCSVGVILRVVIYECYKTNLSPSGQPHWSHIFWQLSVLSIKMVATMIILAEAIVYIRPVRTQERAEGFVYSIIVWLNALLDA